MKIQKINCSDSGNLKFKAGKTNLYSDFDGTYMPKEFNHNSICNKNPEVNKEEFRAYFQKLYDLFAKIKGHDKENKFNFVLTTGRNLHEQNYYFDKIKEQGLRVPLPNSIITCNGQDEFYLDINNEDEYYSNPQKQAFSKTKFNNDKREYYKQQGWDYEKVKTTLINLLKEKQLYVEREFINGHKNELNHHIKTFLNINNKEYMVLEKELQKPNITEKEVRKILEKYSQAKPSTEKEINDYNYHMGQLGYIVWKELNSGITILDNIPTTRSREEYGNNLSLQHQMEKRGLSHENEIYAFSDDGELGLRVAVNSNFKENLLRRNSGKSNKIEILPGNNCETTKLNKGSYIGNEFEIRPLEIDKFQDTKALLNKIIEENSNDLLIVSGDGSNDMRMLNITQYIKNDTDPRTLTKQKFIDKLKSLPLVAIYIDNRTEEEKNKTNSKESKLVKNGDYYNFDGNIRFIHVDPSNPNKPHTLEEATKLAICSYANRNEEFKKNLSPEMKEIVDNYKITYPIDQNIANEANTIYSKDYLELFNFQENFMAINNQYKKLAKLEETFGIKDIEIEACKNDSSLSVLDRLKILGLLLLIVRYKNELKENFTPEKIEELYSKNITKKDSNSVIKTYACIKDEIIYISENEIKTLTTKLTEMIDNNGNSPSKPIDKKPEKNGNTKSPVGEKNPTTKGFKEKFKANIKTLKSWLKRNKLAIALTLLIATSIIAIKIKNKKNKLQELNIIK